ncbi:hypothetical protein BKA82DRAFT_2237345 [Pisolithus tinctorius]|nr:hypothetical protein BKA82DRAFT_2237345 [Pisolithus tinctorius]
MSLLFQVHCVVYTFGLGFCLTLPSYLFSNSVISDACSLWYIDQLLISRLGFKHITTVKVRRRSLTPWIDWQGTSDSLSRRISNVHKSPSAALSRSQ